MNRLLVAPLWLGVAVGFLGSSAFSQQSLRSRLVPVTAPIRNAGIYHVATGTWTRNSSLANVTGPDTIYNNTCAPAYFTFMNGLESFQHRGRIPSTSGPTTPSVFYGTSRYDEAPGCHDAYTVNGFEICYCSSSATTVDWSFDFASSYALCDSGDMVSQYNVTVTGLPSSSYGPSCYIVDIDLSGNTNGGIVLSADGDGTYVGPSTLEQFGFSISQTNHPLSMFTGPVIAGDFTWTGGTVVGSLTPCTGTDGTFWDNPINLAEAGTGMASNNFFRVAATPGPTQFPVGCYTFGNNPHADFWLKLFADTGCPIDAPGVGYCFPGEHGVHACTTCSPANPPSAHNRGCDNFGQQTGGATLSVWGTNSVAHDSIVFTSSFENNTALSVIVQGTATTNRVFGAGIRCVGGDLKRLYVGPAGSAANGDPAGTFHRPGPADARSVTQASLALGYDIAAHAPVVLEYMAYYRDPGAAAHCGGATFNASQGLMLSWFP